MLFLPSPSSSIAPAKGPSRRPSSSIAPDKNPRQPAVAAGWPGPGRQRQASDSWVALAAGGAGASAPQGQRGGEVLTVEEVQQLAAARGLALSLKKLGPLYRVVCREGHEGGKVLGVTSGFIIPPPIGLMHCDTLQIFSRTVKEEKGEQLRGGPLGLGLFLGAAVFAFGAAAGCKKAEILAINDDEGTHARLVRYYQHFGFEPVHVVSGGSLSDLPHMLVWGGAGTRMDADVQKMLGRWAAAVRRERREEGGPVAPQPEPDSAANGEQV